VSEITVVLVDGCNVARSRWPNLPPERVVELARVWAEREDVQLAIVFDGVAPGGLTGAERLDDRTTLVGTGSASADDWIADEARRLGGDVSRLWLVSSDRGLRRRVRDVVDREIGGGTFVSRLEQL
jgi:hypothetical protein